MTRFNYLGESIPTLLDRARSIRIPERTRTPLSILGTSVLVVLGWCCLAHYWLATAMVEERQAQLRLTQSRAALAQAQVERASTDRLVALDRELRAIRLSGTKLGLRLADLANHVPEHSWLTSLSEQDGIVTIDGRSEGMLALSGTLARILAASSVSDPTLFRAARESRPGLPELISFEVRAVEHAK